VFAGKLRISLTYCQTQEEAIPGKNCKWQVKYFLFLPLLCADCWHKFSLSAFSFRQYARLVTFLCVRQWCRKSKIVYYSLIIIEIDDYIEIFGQSWWPRSLRRGSAAARLLELRVQIPVGGIDVCLLCVLCVVTYRSLRRADPPPIPTECVCVCVCHCVWRGATIILYTFNE